MGRTEVGGFYSLPGMSHFHGLTRRTGAMRGKQYRYLTLAWPVGWPVGWSVGWSEKQVVLNIIICQSVNLHNLPNTTRLILYCLTILHEHEFPDSHAMQCLNPPICSDFSICDGKKTV